MKTDLKKATQTRDKAQSLLTNLEELKAKGSISESQYIALRAEYKATYESAVAEINAVHDEENKRLLDKAREGASLKQELQNLEARLKVGEISEKSYQVQANLLRKRLNLLFSVNKNWFQRHLNWSLFFVMVGAPVVMFLLLILFFPVSARLNREYLNVIGWLSELIGTGLSIPMVLWYLKEKGRSPNYGWLVLIGFWWLICLKNWRAEREKFEQEGR